jgi:Fe-S oxidoreductase
MKPFNNCLMREPPFCTANCPFHLDVSDFVEKAGKGLHNTAFRTYRNAVGFPRTVSRICPAPCKSVCPLRGRPIALRDMEQAVVAFADDTRPNNYNIPHRNRRVAIIGAGVSGMGCALRMAAKKYHVEIFESTDRIGGRIARTIDAEVFLKDVEEQFQYEEYTIHFNRTIRTRSELNALGFDAVYAATGKGGHDFGLMDAVGENGDLHCLTDEKMAGRAHGGEENVLSDRAGLGVGRSEHRIGWFAGGGLIGDESVYALADGLLMGNVLDAFLKTGNLLWPKNRFETKMYLNPRKLEDPVSESDPPTGSGEENRSSCDCAGNAASHDGTAISTAAELKAEADRCLRCRCDSCRMFCDLTDFFNKWPPRIRDEVFATTLPGSAEVKATPAKRLMSTCNQCGVCREVCPEDIDMGRLILAGRRSMHRQEKVPWFFHDFWVRDMEFSDGENARLCKSPIAAESATSRPRPERRGNAFAFFPGCQIGASDPDLVLRTYAALRATGQDVGILLRCCGAPAEWSGDDGKHRACLQSITEDWRRMGKPTLLAACPTCIKKFREYLPALPILSVYEALDDRLPSLAPANPKPAADAWAIFDPCSARHREPLKAAVRSLARKAGIALKPLPIQDDIARCCGFGGQPAAANPEYARFVAEKRIAESALPYITYCVNCRDVFTDAGKASKHILEILFPPETQPANDRPADERLSGDRPAHGQPTVTERRNNRIYLKRNLLKTYWGEDMQPQQPTYGFELVIDDALKAKINRQRILESEVYEVVDFLTRTGRRVRNETTGSLSGYKQVGHMTYWVEYRKTDRPDLFLLTNVYAHRMSIERENMWNGVRPEEYLRGGKAYGRGDPDD